MNYTYRVFRDIELTGVSDKYKVRICPTSNNYRVFEMWHPQLDARGNQTESFSGTLSDCYAWIQLKEKGFIC